MCPEKGSKWNLTPKKRKEKKKKKTEQSSGPTRKRAENIAAFVFVCVSPLMLFHRTPGDVDSSIN